MTRENGTNVIHKHKGLSLFFGIILILVGLFTINARIFVSEVTVYFFGWVLLISGGAQCFASFYSGSWNNFFITLITGLISFIIGGTIVVNPNLSTQTFAILISIVLIVDGLFKIARSIAVHAEHWRWGIVTGIVIFLLGIVLWYISPTGNFGIIGFFIGLALVVGGFLTITNAYTDHEVVYKQKIATHPS